MKKIVSLFLIFVAIYRDATASDIVIDSTVTTSQTLNSNGQLISIDDGGNLSVSGSDAIFSDNATGLQISVDSNSISKGIIASGNSGSAISIQDSAELSTISLISGTITSDLNSSNGTIFLGGAGGTTAISTLSGTVISNTSSDGNTINSSTTSDTNLSIDNSGSITAVGGTAIRLTDADGGSSYSITNSGTISSTSGNSIYVGTGNTATINNSGNISGDLSLSGTTTINNSDAQINGNISNSSGILIVNSGTNTISGNINSSAGELALQMGDDDNITGNISSYDNMSIQTTGLGNNTITGNVTTTDGNLILSLGSGDLLTGDISVGGNMTYSTVGLGSNTINASTIDVSGQATFNLSTNDIFNGNITSDLDTTFNITGLGENTISSNITSGGAVAIGLSTDDSFSGDISASDEIGITIYGLGGNSVTGDLTSDSDISLTISTNDSFTGNISAAGNFNYTTTGLGSNLIDTTTINVGDTATLMIGSNDTINGDITANSDIVITTTGLGTNSVNGNITSETGEIAISLSQNDTYVGNISSYGNASIATYSIGNNSITGNVSTEAGNLSMSFASNDSLIGNINVVGNITYTTSGLGSNTIDATSISATGTASFSFGNDDVINGDITSGGDLTLTTGAGGGNVITGNIASTGGGASISLYTNDQINGGISAANNLAVGVYGTGNNSITGNVESSTGDLNLSLASSDTIIGDVSAGSVLTYQSTGTGSNTITGDVTSGSHMSLTLMSGDVINGDIQAGGDFTLAHSGDGDISVNGSISNSSGSLTIDLKNSDAITGDISTTSGQATITLNDSSSIVGDINLGSNSASSLSVQGSSFSGDITMGDASQSVDFDGSSIIGSINGSGRLQISSDPTSFDLDIGNNSAISRLVLTDNVTLNMASNNNILVADNVELYEGSQLVIGNATTNAEIDGQVPGRGSVLFNSSTTKNYNIGSTSSIASVVINTGQSLTNSGDIVADSISIANNASITSSSGTIGVSTAPITLAPSSVLTINGGTVAGVIDGSINNQGTFNVGSSSFTSTQNIGTTHYLNQVAVTSGGNFTNNAAIHATSLNVAGTFNVGSGSLDVDNITNSGTITASSGDAIVMTQDNLTINNSGQINAGSVSDNAINITGDNLTVNIFEGSSISGNIVSSGSGNVLNLRSDITATSLNALSEQLVGSWTKNIASDGSISVNTEETLSTSLTLSGGRIDNSGTVGDLSVSGSGSMIVLASTSVTGDINNSGSLSLYSASPVTTYNSEMSGTGSLTKVGLGRLDITNTNTYSGTTTVSAGELKVNGSIASSAVTVASGSTISGTGTVGALTINSGGTLSPGNSPGTLNVSGALTLNSGSTSNFEFTDSVIDKVIASGNVTLGGTANFQLYGTDGYFTVSQDIIETTGGTVSGTFNSTTTNNNFVTNLTYGTTAVNARISKTLDSNTLDGTLSSQNSVGRLVSKSLMDKLRNSQYLNQKNTVWFDSGAFNSYMGSNTNSSAYTTNGYVTSAGFISNLENLQFIGGVFNSHAKVKRFVYLGKDEIDTNGFTVGLGKNTPNFAGNLYSFIQSGVGFYDFTNSRTVNVNGSRESAHGNGTGLFEYVGIGAAQSIPLSTDKELGIFANFTLQKTSHNGWHETGLSSGNLAISRSSANTSNLEVGASYKNNLAHFLKLPKGAFYKLEISGYKSELYAKHDATVQDGSAFYSLSPTYNQKFIFGSSALFSTPISQNSTIFTRLDKRQNGTMREFIATVGYTYGF